MEEIKKAASDTAVNATNIPFVAEQQTSKPYDGENPGTIQELKQWYADHKLPDENITRFFIGKNLTVPRVFGIYQDEVTGKFVVYKNKNDGTRAVRYQGTDEAFAVREYLDRLKLEIKNQESHHNWKMPKIDIPVNSGTSDTDSEPLRVTPPTKNGNKEIRHTNSSYVEDDDFKPYHSERSSSGCGPIILFFFILFLVGVILDPSKRHKTSSSHENTYESTYDSYDSSYDSGWDAGDTDFDSDW